MRKVREQGVFYTALYLRLSKDDQNASESASIATQRSILLEFAKANELCVVEEYADDGYSGTSYDRPAFQRLIADIERGRINCVLTKDLSRLGRNSARTSDLLDEYFPSRRVRFISVIDGYDSFHLTNGASMLAPFMTVMHEMYARDISNKIRASIKAKMEKGDYIASFAPYGYKKDLEHGNKNRLVVDEQTAPIVQTIFQMAAKGHSPSEIAEHLNALHVATPAFYRRFATPFVHSKDPLTSKEWTSSSICKMLCNEVYLGKTIQGKSSKLSFKERQVQSNPRDEWICVENTHAPLIDEELYRLARKRSVARRCPPTKEFHNVFSGVAKCADCGKSMTLSSSRRKEGGYALCCGGYKAHGSKACSNHFIDYDLLYNAVLKELQTWLLSAREDLEQLQDNLHRQAPQEPAFFSMAQRLCAIKGLTKTLYEEYALGRLSVSTYRRLLLEYESESAALETALQNASRPRQTALPCEMGQTIYPLEALTKPLLHALIDRIEIEQGEYGRDEQGKRQKIQRIRIFYLFGQPSAAAKKQRLFPLAHG